MEVWQTITLALGGNAALFAVLGWLSKSFVSQLLTKDVENFKATLRAESELASHKLRHDLEKATIEHQVRFSKLHEKRAEVITELYDLLVQAHWELSSFVSIMDMKGEPDKKAKYVIAMNGVVDFRRFFEKQRIYLPEKVCLQIDSFVEGMGKKAVSFGTYLKYEGAFVPVDIADKKDEAWMAAWDFFKEEVPAAKTALENELRKILGGIS